MLTFYIKGRSSLRIQSLTAGITLIAARFATVAPHGEIRTLDEQGLLADRFGELARHGAPVYVFGAVLKLGASARTRRCSRAYPYGRMAPDWPHFASNPTTIHHQTFFASKGSVW